MNGITRQFHIEQGCHDGGTGYWSACPGGSDDRAIMDAAFCICYRADGEMWAIGIAFHSRRCAESALARLLKSGVTPASYHALTDTHQVRREIIENLLW